MFLLVVDALSSYIPLREGAWQTDHNNSLFSTLPNYMASKSRAKNKPHKIHSKKNQCIAKAKSLA